MKPTIQLRSGAYFDFMHPESSDFTIDDIAHALSQINRFTGHTRFSYSVAQHSVLVSHIVPAEHALAGLLHDAHEAFVGDVPSPLKMLLPDYRAIEKAAERAVHLRYGIPLVNHAEIKRADLQMLATEKAHLMPKGDEHWECLNGVPLAFDHITPVTSYFAKHEFLSRFRVLSNLREAAEA